MAGKAWQQEQGAAGHPDPESASREGDVFAPLGQKELHVGIAPKQCLQNMPTSVTTEKKESQFFLLFQSHKKKEEGLF